MADSTIQGQSANTTGQKPRIKSQNMGPLKMGQNPKLGAAEVFFYEDLQCCCDDFASGSKVSLAGPR